MKILEPNWQNCKHRDLLSARGVGPSWGKTRQTVENLLSGSWVVPVSRLPLASRDQATAKLLIPMVPLAGLEPALLAEIACCI